MSLAPYFQPTAEGDMIFVFLCVSVANLIANEQDRRKKGNPER